MFFNNKSSEMNLNLGNFFDREFSYLLKTEISSIPNEIKEKLIDKKNYEISREGVTTRYQMIVLPFFERHNFNVDLLCYFLRNSIFSPKQNQSFPYLLIGFLIGTLTENLVQNENNNIFNFPSYMKNGQLTIIKRKKLFKKCIFLMFDC